MKHQINNNNNKKVHTILMDKLPMYEKLCVPKIPNVSNPAMFLKKKKEKYERKDK